MDAGRALAAGGGIPLNDPPAPLAGGREPDDLLDQNPLALRRPNTYGFAAVHAIRVHPDGLDGGADPGHDGIVLAV